MAWLIKGAHVVDPQVGLDEVVDVLVEGKNIAQVGKDLTAEGAEVIDGAGKHYNLIYYGDNRYAYTIAKTAGDAKAGMNAAASIATLVL